MECVRQISMKLQIVSYSGILQTSFEIIWGAINAKTEADGQRPLKHIEQMMVAVYLRLSTAVQAMCAFVGT